MHGFGRGADFVLSSLSSLGGQRRRFTFMRFGREQDLEAASSQGVSDGFGAVLSSVGWGLSCMVSVRMGIILLCGFGGGPDAYGCMPCTTRANDDDSCAVVVVRISA